MHTISTAAPSLLHRVTQSSPPVDFLQTWTHTNKSNKQPLSCHICNHLYFTTINTVMETNLWSQGPNWSKTIGSARCKRQNILYCIERILPISMVKCCKLQPIHSNHNANKNVTLHTSCSLSSPSCKNRMMHTSIRCSNLTCTND